jgi:hypothetical protein
MVAEIMACTMQVENPFEIDFEFIHHLPLPEALLLTSALVKFLETIYVEAGPEIGFVDKGNTLHECDVTERTLVCEDIQQLELKRFYLTRTLSSEDPLN